ncbi:hypothetical protein ABPG75_004124 [Micractinium tetrahymenae]
MEKPQVDDHAFQPATWEAVEAPDTPPADREPPPPRLWAAPSALASLPPELGAACLGNLQYEDLCSLACTCSALREAAEDCLLWRREWQREFGEAGALQEAAAALAGGWKRLFAARHAVQLESYPWIRPSAFEVAAAVDALVALPPRARPAGSSAAHAEGEPEWGLEGEEVALCLVFLMDGSSSVHDQDFQAMKDFISRAVQALEAAPHGPRSRVAVIQFSDRARVEQGPVAPDPAQLEALLGSLCPLRGCTCTGLALEKAGDLLCTLGRSAHGVLALLTDGQVSYPQSVAAATAAARLAAQAGCSVRLHGFGVGRGMDRESMLRIIGAGKPAGASDRYLDLMVLDDA